ncbi:MAG: serine/threonine protein kinase, partial [Microbacterium sp.]
AVVVLGGAGIAWAAGSGAFGPSGQEPAPSASGADPQDPVNPSAPRVEDLEGTVVGSEVVFTWTNPDPQDGDTYLWTLEPAGQPESVTEPTVTVPAQPSGTTCIEVVLVRANRTSSLTGVEGCAP